MRMPNKKPSHEASLLSLQQHFQRALLHDAPDIHALIAPSAISAEARVAVYKRNSMHAMRHALGLIYPTIEKLVGDAYFTKLAHHYATTHPPSEGNLDAYGAYFPFFINQHALTQKLPYATETAWLDLAIHRVSCAGVQAALKAHHLPTNVDDYATLTLRLNPTARLVHGVHAIYDIWHFSHHAHAHETLEDINATQHVLVSKTHGGVVQTELLSDAFFAFVDALENGCVLHEAHAVATQHEAGFDLAKAMEWFMVRDCFSA